MPKGTRVCKVCGRKYEYCKTFITDNRFRYQDVACSPECGAEYFARIEASRSGKAVGTVEEAPAVKEVIAEKKPSKKKKFVQDAEEKSED